MAIKNRKTCVIISQSSFLSEFIDNFGTEQWLIEAVISDVYSRIRSINTEIDCNPLETCVEKILAIKPDYVFSIVNPVILPQIILTKSICINFHPSLLPYYRGVCPTNWAIYHHEKIHGYTWHVMSLKIDQGAIVFQAKVPVLKEDTAKTLMLRCYKKAIEDFPQLLRILLVGPSNTTMGESKQIKQAKYYSYGNKPNFLLTALADHRLPDRLLRAATAIDSYNDFGVVKVYIDDQFYILNSLKNQQDSYCRENDSVIVYDNKRYVAELASLDGNPVIVQSAYLSSLPDKLIKQYLSYCNQVASKEQYWLKLLRNFRSPKLFSYINHSNQSHAGNYHFQCDFLHHCQLNYSPDQIIFALWCTIIAKITDADKVSLWVRHDFKIEEVLQPLFYDYVPLDLLTDQNQTIQQYIDKVIGIKQKASLKHCFATDLFARDSLLKERGALPSFSFVISENQLAIKCDDNHPVIFTYHCANNTMDVDYYLPENSFLTKALAYFKEYFTLLLAYDVNTKLSKVSLNKTKSPQPINTHEFLKKNPKYCNRINQLVRKNAKAAPNHIILEQGDKKYTYKVLLQDFSLTSNRLASYIQPSTIIGLVLPRGYVFIKYMLAILERQAAYFPILYDMKTPVMLDLMTDIGTTAFISDREVDDSRVDTKVKIDDQVWFYKLKALSNRPQLSTATAYVMFTSGSTGKPKAIPVKHYNIINLCEDKWVQKLSQHKKIMHASQVSFDGSTFEIWSALLNIGTICVLEKLSLITDVRVMSLFLKQHQIETVILSTKILETEWASSTIDLSSTKYLKFIGESCQLDILKKFSKQHTHIELLNGYGPTENTACSSLCLFDDKTYINDYPNIGYPLDNIITNIYDSYLNVMPYYIPGRLFLSGLSLFDGYLNAPNTSLVNYQGSQQYNSGDICYLGADNALYIIGRDDKMVKLHGYRIELKHLEQVLSFNTQVISAKAEIVANQFNQPSLVAFIIEKGLNRHSYERKIAEKLPAYMCPKYYIYLKKWPLTHHGKLDKKALLQTFKKYLQDRHLGLHSESNDVNAVIGLFKAILNVDNVDQHDDFFKLGGDSLRLIALKAQVKALFNVELLLQYFLDQPTPYGLYQLIHSNTENSDMPRQQGFEQSISEYCQKINTLTIATQANFSDDQDFILLTGASGFVGGQTLFFYANKAIRSIAYCAQKMVQSQRKNDK